MRRTQRGESLVGTMIGLALSLLTAVAMLIAYRTMVGVSVPATRTAKREGQAAAALLTAQTELQQAGFGIRDTDPGPSWHLSESNKKLVWRFRQTLPAGPIMCAGLRLQASTPVSETDGIYFLLPQGCGDADDATAFTPRLLATASVLFEPSTADTATTTGESRSYDLSHAEFVLTAAANCGPYGVPGSSDSSQVVQLKDTRADTNPANDIVVFSQCLSNL